MAYGLAAGQGDGLSDAQSVAVDGAGNAYVVGRFSGTVDFDRGAGVSLVASIGDNNTFFAKYDADGNLDWVRVPGASSIFHDIVNVAVDPNGIPYLAGTFIGTVDLDPGTGVATRTSGSGSSENFYVARYDVDGNLTWVYAPQPGSGVHANGIDFDSAGNVYAVGYMNGGGDFDNGPGTVNLFGGGGFGNLIVKLNSSGSFQWAKTSAPLTSPIETDRFIEDVAVDGSGNAYVVGRLEQGTVDFDSGAANVPLTSVGVFEHLIAKYDSSGSLLWAHVSKNTTASLNTQGRGVAVDDDGNVYAAGFFTGTVDFDPGVGVVNLTAANQSFFLTKYTSAGNLVWAKTSAPSVSNISANDVAVDDDGFVYIGGHLSNLADLDPGAGTVPVFAPGSGANQFIAKFNSDGQVIWAKSSDAASGGETRGQSVAVDDDGNAYLAGFFIGTRDFDPGTGTAQAISGTNTKHFLAVFTPSGNLRGLDASPPETTLTGGPSGPVTTASATFNFDSNDTAAVFDAVVDGTTYAGVTDALTLTSLAQGSHTLIVAARDTDGYVDQTPATRSWFIDSIDPETTLTGGPTGLVNSNTATFAFDSADPTAVFDAVVDGTTHLGVTDTLTLTGLAQGSHTLAVAARDSAGNVDDTPATRSWSVDTVDPETTLTGGPTGLVATNTASFAFDSADAAAVFDAVVDGTTHASLADGLTLTGLAQGTHTLVVAARDPAGNVDETPSTRSWSVDTIDPETTLAGGPSGPVASASATFSFDSADSAAVFDAVVDGTTHAGLADGLTLTGLSQGAHTLVVAARDLAGNVDETPATRSWFVDTIAPETTFALKPAALSDQATAVFDFGPDEAGTVFEGTRDGVPFSVGAGTITFSGLAEGGHTLTVAARDAAGNVDASPATHSWTIDTIDPDTTLIGGPTGLVASATATFSFDSTDPTAVFDAVVDGTTQAGLADGLTLSGLSQGPHTLFVAARDPAGNPDGTPEGRTWTVDTLDPDTTIVTGPAGLVNSDTAIFAFDSNEDAAVFDVTVDGTTHTGLADGLTLNGLAQGLHSLVVTARDAIGNLDDTPAIRTWSVDTIDPDTTILSGPSGVVAVDAATFDFASPDATAVFDADVNGTAYTGVTDALTLTGLAAGTYSLTVVARDPAGNMDETPESRTWTVDAAPPDTSIVSGPSGLVNSRTANFDFGANESGVSYEASLDGAPFTSVSDPKSYGGLADGTHTLLVRASDSAGNTDATPATRIWSIDATAPVVPTVTAYSTDDGDVGDSVTTDRSLTVSGTAEANATVHVFRDGVEIGTAAASGAGAWSFADPAVQAYGRHLFRASAEDAAGNESGQSTPLAVTVVNPAATPSNGNDLLGGDAGANQINGGNGDDTIFGLAGNDTLRGVNGNDRLDGGSGSDRAEGGEGADTVAGGADNDSVFGENGNDRIAGDGGNDRLEGGAGADSIHGGDGADTLIGTAGNDTLTGGNGADKLTGGVDPDRIELEFDGWRDTVYGTVAELSGDQIDGFLAGSPTNPGADVLVIQGLSVANAKKLDGDFVDANDRLSLGDVGGTFVTLVGLAGHQVDTMLGADGVQIWII